MSQERSIGADSDLEPMAKKFKENSESDDDNSSSKSNSEQEAKPKESIIPDFDTEFVEYWFLKIESEFQSRNIMNDKSKHLYVIKSLEKSRDLYRSIEQKIRKFPYKQWDLLRTYSYNRSVFDIANHIIDLYKPMSINFIEIRL